MSSGDAAGTGLFVVEAMALQRRRVLVGRELQLQKCLGIATPMNRLVVRRGRWATRICFHLFAFRDESNFSGSCSTFYFSTDVCLALDSVYTFVSGSRSVAFNQLWFNHILVSASGEDRMSRQKQVEQAYRIRRFCYTTGAKTDRRLWSNMMYASRQHVAKASRPVHYRIALVCHRSYLPVSLLFRFLLRVCSFWLVNCGTHLHKRSSAILGHQPANVRCPQQTFTDLLAIIWGRLFGSSLKPFALAREFQIWHDLRADF